MVSPFSSYPTWHSQAQSLWVLVWKTIFLVDPAVHQRSSWNSRYFADEKASETGR
jgi:hypothetical protein